MMRSNIRWLGFSQDLPLALALGFGWLFCNALVGVVVAVTLQHRSQWLQLCLYALPQVAFGCLVFWVVKRARLLRICKLASVAEQMGMTFVATLADEAPLPPHDLPLMVRRKGLPRNILSGDISNIKVRLFDLAAGLSNSTRDQTVAYFPDALPRLSDFPTGFLGGGIPQAYATVLREFRQFTVEARAGRLIVYRWHHRVKPESYPEFLDIACKVRCALASIDTTSVE